MRLEAKHVKIRRGSRMVLDGVNLGFRAGEITAIIGPNGSGKSTLLMALAGLRPLELGHGEIRFEDQALASLSKARLAKRIAFLPASTSLPFPLTVHELVRQAEPRPQAYQTAIQAMELEGLEFVPLTRLSTGEAKRAWLALTLARETPMVLLDEPLSGLDPRYQMRLLETLEARARNGTSVAFVAHDLPYASRVDRVVALGAFQGGSSVVAEGTPHEVLQPELLRRLYGVEVWLGLEPDSGAIYPLPVRAIQQP